MQGDLFTIKNAQQTIFQQQTGLFAFKKFDILELIAKFFYFRMNLLLMLFNKL